MGNFLTIDGLKTVLDKINEMFSRKNHTHNVKEISGVSKVATTGNYKDLKNLPSIPVVKTATTSEAGIVRVGDGLEMRDGRLCVDIDKTISAYSWKGIYEKLQSLIEQNPENKSVIITRKESETYTGGNTNNPDEKPTNPDEQENRTYNKRVDFTINLSEDIIKNFDIIFNYVSGRITEKVTGIKDDQTDPVGIDGICSKNIDLTDGNSVIYYEFIKIISTDTTIDSVEMYLYENLLSEDRKTMIESIGRIVPDIVTLVEYNDNRRKIFTHPSSIGKEYGVTYIAIDNEVNNEINKVYTPLVNILINTNNN